MIWIIASIPFWVIAAILAGAAIYGLAKTHTQTTKKDFNDLVGGSFVLLLTSGIFAIIAAKICS